MVFSAPPLWLIRTLSLLLGLLVMGFSQPALALPEVIDVSEMRLEPVEGPEGGWELSADFNFELNPRLEEAVSRGVPLYFVTEFELTRPRWYWFDEQTVTVSQTYRLSYNAITRQYRLAFGGLQQGFSSLKEAVSVLSRLRRWKVIEKGGLKPNTSYLVSLRMRLDVTQLPKPFQVNAITNRDWNLSSDWKRFAFVPGPDTLKQ